MFNLNFLADRYKLIMVDIDNTLFNYTLAHKRGLECVFKKFNINIKDYELAKKQIHKRNLSSNHHKKELYFKVICENNNLHFSMAKDMFNFYNLIFNNNLKVDKSMFNFLYYAKKNNRKIVAITNFYFIEQINKLQKSNLLNLIDYLVCSEEFELEKPNRALINRALELYNDSVDEKDIVMIGDSIVDDFLGYGYEIYYYPYNCSKLLVSISGKSGSGKTTLSKCINEVYKSFIINADGYHKYNRKSKIWDRITHYNPEANNLVQLALDIKYIYQNIQNICIPIYNHSDGEIFYSNEICVNDLDLVLIEGLHTLYEEVIGEFVKIKIFLESDLSDIQKINRDILERKYERNKVVQNIEKREQDYIKYLQKQKYNANFLITIKDNEFSIELKDILLCDFLNKTYKGNYEQLIPTVKMIFNKILNNRWVEDE
ncbi:HAD-IA family hydrolase [Campylobacter sp. RM9929]|uniref:HAD-IA family hydrolase n=1 Tax=Campylobacter molothri TaxID=1032242 RepID=UPI001D8CE34F|nr:HAD-IA family hydrolase [Campylobacter sp. RM9929]MBZ7955606.1 HAD-IA family hydrolase [Campylobacter sp. RM17709]